MKKFLGLALICLLAIVVLSMVNRHWQKQLPTVVEIKEFANGATDVDPSLTKLHLRFSEPMDTHYSGFDFGPLGKANTLYVKQFSFLEDEQEVSFVIDLEPQKQYEVWVTTAFRNKAGVRIDPYLLRFKTGK